jgi:putative ABC transport system permease protein
VPINDQLTGNITERTWLAFITAGALVLLIACANVANLLLMRGAARAGEMAIRASIGATRGRLVRQLLIESAILALLGGIFGVAVSLAGLNLLSAMVPRDALFYWMTFTIDGRVLGVLMAVCLGSVFVFGLAPSLNLLKVDLTQVTRDTGRTGAVALPARRWMTAFLVVEFALSLVLLAAVVAGIRQQRANERAEFPLDPAPILSMWVTLPNEAYETPERRTAFYDRMTDRFAAVPGVSAVTIASVMPRIGGPRMELEIADQPSAPGDALPTVVVVSTGDGYFSLLDVPLVRGREFTSFDGRPGQEAAIVNQRFVEMFLGNTSPIDRLIRVRRLGTNAQGPWARIVGVSPTIRQFGGITPGPVVYLPFRVNPSPTAAVMVRAVDDAAELAPGLREELRRLDPHIPFYRLMTLDRAIAEAQWNARMAMVVIQNIGAIALLMALVGLYAVTAHAVHRWRSELAIRIALGARPRSVAWLVLRRALAQLGMGLVAGVLFTFVFDRLFTDAAQQDRMTDLIVLVPIVGVIVTVAIAACILPIRRAVYLDPVEALRAE